MGCNDISWAKLSLLAFCFVPLALRANPTTTPTLGAGGSFTVFLKADGSLWTVGANHSGQLGDGTTARQATPQQLVGNVAQVVAGFAHTLFIKTDGSLWGTGDNFYGELGDFDQHLTPVQITTAVRSVTAGNYYTLFIKDDDALWGMGDNFYGQLGDGSGDNQHSPVLVATGVLAVAGGQYHSLFVKTDGTLWAMGDNGYGQLGDGTQFERDTPVQIASGVLKVAAGFNFSLFLKTNGTLWGMGHNAYGQLGDGTTMSRLAPVQIAANVQDISCGSYHSLILKTDGSLVGSGWNTTGQLARSDPPGNNGYHPNAVSIAANVRAIAAGNLHTLYVTADGRLFAVGNNDAGQLGDGGTSARYTPVQAATGVATEGPSSTPTPTPGGLLNISTRMRVLTGDNALIAGFIITGTQPKEVIVRGIGPSLPLSGVLADPTLEVHDSSGQLIAFNDNWRDAATVADIQRTLPPTNDLESALWGILNPGAYTLVLRGKNNGTGVGVVEAYDLDQQADSKLANISSRGFVDTGDNVMIGGLIIGANSSTSIRVVLRAIGPSLTQFGINNALADPTLDLRDSNGTALVLGDDWQSDPGAAEIQTLNLAPSDPHESATLQTLSPGAYTAIVRGKNNTTGVALVEAYNVGVSSGPTPTPAPTPTPTPAPTASPTPTPSPTDVERFNGSYTGSYSGTAFFDGGSSAPVSGSVGFTVANGVITVTAPGSGSGTVSSSGDATFTGSGTGDGASYTFSGTFSVSPSGNGSASGSWNASFTGGTASGAWSAARP